LVGILHQLAARPGEKESPRAVSDE